MHPILGYPRRLGLYLIAWLSLSELLFYLVTYHSGIGWLESATFFFPLCLFYAFVCLSAWYSCRGIPLEETSFTGLLFPHLLAAIIVGSFWVLVAKALARALSQLPRFYGLHQKIARDIPLVLAIGVLLYLLAVALFYVLQAQEASREAEQRESEARVLARDAELRALKAQVNPHFLFNSLHSISALTSSDPKRGREMCIALADFLRATLGLGEKTLIPLEEEMSLIHSFLAVEKIRFGARLQMDERIDQETLSCMVPPLILQPLVENAVTHGIANLTEGGWISLRAIYHPETDTVVIDVENSFDPDAPARKRSGVGLVNVRQRLNTRYGTLARFAVEKNAHRFHVGLVLPAERKAVPA
ncbi:MAG TPA: histidine kinase [Terriglobales bacterium]|jgi:two-component system sensor histidine kinase AlgZ|nr:histidine kinase [Terriglobales bacterium]